MADSSRRSVIRAFGALAAMPLLSVAGAASAAVRPIRFPTGLVDLTRVLERDLADGATIRVVRRWECEFGSFGAGARVNARQIASKVEAPAALAAFARIEEQREVTGLFPVELDRNGIMVGWTDGQPDSIQGAIDRAIGAIEAAVPPAEELSSAREFLSSLGAAAASVVSQVPRDLFFPEAGERAETRPMTLPGGVPASYEVAIESAASLVSGLLEHTERRVVTHIGESSRTTLERWEIGARGL